MDDITIIKIRKGMSGFPYSSCTEDGYLIGNSDSIEEIRDRYKREIRAKVVKIVKELDQYPAGYEPTETVYGYARVSTRRQAKDGYSLDAQEAALKAAGAEIVIREQYTGATTQRPELDKLIKKLKGGDTLIVTKLDRIARSAVQGEQLIADLIDRHVKIHILNMGVIDNSTTGKLVRQIFFAFAEFERDMIQERMQEGKVAAKANNPNYKEGRPRIDKDRMDHAMSLLESNSYDLVAAMTGISKSSLTREKRRRKGLG